MGFCVKIINVLVFQNVSVISYFFDFADSFRGTKVACIGAHTLAFCVHRTNVLTYALHNGYIIVNVKISRHNSFQMIKHLKICKKQEHKYFSFLFPCFYRTCFGFGRIEFLPKPTETNEFDAMGHGLE